MSKSNKLSPEVRERAVRMVQEHRGAYPSLSAANKSIEPKIGHAIDGCLRRSVDTPIWLGLAIAAGIAATAWRRLLTP